MRNDSVFDGWLRQQRVDLLVRATVALLSGLFHIGISLWLLMPLLIPIAAFLTSHIELKELPFSILASLILYPFLVVKLLFGWDEGWSALLLCAAVVLLVLMGWAALRLWRLGWPESGEPFRTFGGPATAQFMNSRRAGNVSLGYAASALWAFMWNLHTRPVYRIIRVVRRVQELRRTYTPLPEEAGRELEPLLRDYRLRSWNPVADYPALLPLLEPLLALRIIRTRETYGVGVEVRPTEEYLKYLQKQAARAPKAESVGERA